MKRADKEKLIKPHWEVKLELFDDGRQRVSLGGISLQLFALTDLRALEDFLSDVKYAAEQKTYQYNGGGIMYYKLSEACKTIKARFTAWHLQNEAEEAEIMRNMYIKPYNGGGDVA